jgi:hypothetical protein
VAPSLGAVDGVLEQDSFLDKMLGLVEVEELVDPPSNACLGTMDLSFDLAWATFVEIGGGGAFECFCD